MLKYFINDIELDINDISSLEVVESVITIFPEIELTFQDINGVFSEFNPMVNDSVFSIVRDSDNATEFFKIAKVSELENRELTDTSTGANYITYRVKACYINPSKNIYSVGQIINTTSNFTTIMNSITQSLGLRFVNQVSDERIYSYYTFKTSYYNQLKMLVEQINDSWVNRKCVLYYTLFSQTLTLVDIEDVITSKRKGIELVDSLSLQNSMALDYTVPNSKAISGYDYDRENFDNYDIPIVNGGNNRGDVEIYSNMLDEEIQNSLHFYLHNKSLKINLNFNTLDYNLGTKLKMSFNNRVNSTYNSENSLLNGNYMITERKLTVTNSGAGIQSLTIVNPFLNK